jgi:beta-xylosidase
MPSTGIFAPTLRHHAGRFWLITTDTNSKAEGQLLMTAEDAAGPWSDPIYVPVVGIDPDITWAGDRCYVSWAQWDSDAGESGIWQVQIDDQTGALLEAPHHLWSGTGLAYPEGPHLYLVEDWWYLMIAEGGTEHGHGVSIARARDVRGPFDPAANNPIFSHRSLDLSVQNTGHADLIQLPGGGWAAVYLGVRLSGTTPYYHLNGRETFLAGIEWIDGWPRFVEDHYEVAEIDRSFVDEFEVDELAPRWVSVLGHESGRHRDGGELLLGADEHRGDSALLLTRVRDAHWAARAAARISGGTCRLVLRIDDKHWYGVNLTDSHAWAQLCIGGHDINFGLVPVSNRGIALLEARSVAPSGDLSHAPDVIELSITTAGERIVLCAVDGRYLSTEVAGGFTGRMLGIEAVAGQARVTNFEYTTES